MKKDVLPLFSFPVSFLVDVSLVGLGFPSPLDGSGFLPPRDESGFPDSPVGGLVSPSDPPGGLVSLSDPPGGLVSPSDPPSGKEGHLLA